MTVIVPHSQLMYVQHGVYHPDREADPILREVAAKRQKVERSISRAAGGSRTVSIDEAVRRFSGGTKPPAA